MKRWQQDESDRWCRRVPEIDNGKLLRELLAAIHRDGGHYTIKHGVEKSVEDAIKIILPLNQGEEND